MSGDNVWLSPDDFGALQQVPGFTKINPSEVSGAIFHRTARAVKSDGTSWNLLSYTSGGNDFVIRMDAVGATNNVWIHSDTPALTEPDFSSAVLNDLIFLVNGVDTVPKHDFSSLSAAGVTRPSVTNASLALNSGGNNAVKGVVNYFISQLTGTTEGALSVEIGPIDTANGNRVDVNLTHADFAGKTYLVYRTQANEATPFFVAEAAGGATYTDDTPDRLLGSEPFLNGDPPLAAFLDLAVWNDRVWALTKDSVLYWSDPENPESNATANNGNFIPINEDDGDFGVALVREPSGLAVIKTDHIYRIFGTAPDGIEIRELTLATQEGGSLGAPSKAAITGVDQGVAFYWRRGVYVLLGGEAQEISSSIRDDLAGIRSQDEADGVYLGFYKKRRLLFVSAPLSSGTTPTHTWIYSFDRGDWIGRLAVGFRGFLSTEDANGDEQFWGMSPDRSSSIRDDLAGIRSQDEADGVYLGFYKKRRLLFVSAPLSSGTTPTHTWIYSFDRGDWIGRLAVGFRGFLSTEDANGDEQFWGMSPDSGFAYNLDDGQTYAGATISTEAKLRPFMGFRPAALKHFLSVDVHFVPQTSGTITLSAIIDGLTASAITATVEMAESGHETFRRRINIGEFGHELQLKITSNADQPAWLIPRMSLRWHEYDSDPF